MGGSSYRTVISVCLCVQTLFFLVIRRRLYQYGKTHADLKLANDVDKTCDYAEKFCYSGSIRTPSMQVFDTQLKDIRVNLCYSELFNQIVFRSMNGMFIL